MFPLLIRRIIPGHLKVHGISLFYTFFISSILPLSAQESKLLNDKPGTFKLANYGVYDQTNCGFTKGETSANTQKLLALTDAIRKNPVLNNPRGFDGKADKTNWKCDPKNGYGIPSEICIQFCSWSLEKGKEVCWSGEPPYWTLNINRLRTLGAAGFNETTDEPSHPRAGFNMEQWEKAAEKVNELFYPLGKKEILEPGLDRYNGIFMVVYNPERPPYWLPVTIRETFALLYDYWRKHPVQETSETMVRMLDKEYATFSGPELDGYAYFGDSNSIFRIGTNSTQLPVMRVNPAYWNRGLPRSAIQFLTFDCPSDKKMIREEKEERLKNNNGYYHLSRFIETLDCHMLVPLIDR